MTSDTNVRLCSLAMRKASVLAVAVAALVACTKTNPKLVCDDGQCSDPGFPFCDVDGAVGGAPNTCLAVSCSPGAFAACDGDKAVACNTDGNNYVTTSCEFGCSAANMGCNQCAANTASCDTGAVNHCDANGIAQTEVCASSCIDAPSPHCGYISPRYLADVCDTSGQGTLTISQSGSIDTDLDNNCNGGIVSQPGAPTICVMRYRNIKVADGAVLKVISSVNRDVNLNMFGQGRALALVADDSVDIDGILDVSADGQFSGPGGGYSKSGGAVAGGKGAGGAGFATTGGAGGSPATDGGAVNGGALTMDPASLASFIGGPSGPGGGGGGGALLIACRGTVSVVGLIDAGGGGGVGGWNLPFANFPGGGGGAGGYVVLQGLQVSVVGEIYANGGGGGAGATTSNGTTFEDGKDGSLSDSTSASGGIAQSGAGNGGAGGVAGIAMRAPGSGLHPTTTGNGPGGGGGSVGFFQTYTPNSVTPTLTPSHASPRLQPNANVPTR